MSLSTRTAASISSWANTSSSSPRGDRSPPSPPPLPAPSSSPAPLSPATEAAEEAAAAGLVKPPSPSPAAPSSPPRGDDEAEEPAAAASFSLASLDRTLATSGGLRSALLRRAWTRDQSRCERIIITTTRPKRPPVVSLGAGADRCSRGSWAGGTYSEGRRGATVEHPAGGVCTYVQVNSNAFALKKRECFSNAFHDTIFDHSGTPRG